MKGHEGQGRSGEDRLIHEHLHDPYRRRKKPHDPACCPQCSAVFQEGRWRWGAPPAGGHEELCPACQRQKDGLAAGNVILKGEFQESHRDEIIGLVKNEEAREKEEHPLNRIMKIEENGKMLVVQTTDIHLPRRIGVALHNAWGGELDLQYEEEEYFIRVTWQR